MDLRQTKVASPNRNQSLGEAPVPARDSGHLTFRAFPLACCARVLLAAAISWLPPAFRALAQTTARPQAAGEVSGELVDAASGRPIPRGEVAMLCEQALGDAKCPRRMSMNTGGDGSFQFGSVVPGRYFLIGIAAGYVSGTGEATQEVRVDPGFAAKPIQIRLVPTGEISGRVIREDKTPLPGVEVDAVKTGSLQAGRGKPSGRCVTDGGGRCTIAGLAPGDYSVLARLAARSGARGAAGASAPGVGVAVYYPGVLNAGDAAPVSVAPGQKVAGIVVRVGSAAVHRVSGRVEGLASGVGSRDVEIDLKAKSGPGPEWTVRPGQGGEFVFAGVPSGVYMLDLVGSDWLAAPASGAPRPFVRRLLAPREEVEVGDEDVADVRVEVRPPVVVSGAIAVGDGTKAELRGMRFALLPTREYAGLGRELAASAGPDGAFRFTGCQPMRYTLSVSALGGLYVSDIALNFQDARARAIDLSRGGGDLRVVLRGDGAEVDASLESPGEGSPWLVLLPDDFAPDTSVTLPRAAFRDGSSRVRDLRPGHYTVLAVPSFEPSRWSEPEFVIRMRGLGEGVDLSPRGRVSVQLRTVTGAAIDAAPRGVGAR